MASPEIFISIELMSPPAMLLKNGATSSCFNCMGTTSYITEPDGLPEIILQGVLGNYYYVGLPGLV